MGKTCNVSDAVAAIADGATLMIGGFMGVGSPSRLIDELVRQGKHELTVIANDSARPGVGVGKLVGARLVRRLVTSHIGTNPETQRQMIAGELTSNWSRREPWRSVFAREATGSAAC